MTSEVMAHLPCWGRPGAEFAPVTGNGGNRHSSSPAPSSRRQHRTGTIGGSPAGIPYDQTIWSKVHLGPSAAASLASHVISTALSRSAKAT
jgi:hypothetical protein